MNIKNFDLPYRGLPRSIYIIFITRIVNAMGNFVFPFMTLLLKNKIGMNEKEMGIYLLAAAVLQIPGSLLGGKLSDVMGRKKIIVLFMVLSAICTLSCTFLIGSNSTIYIVPYLLIGTSLFRSIAHPATGAMTNDLTTPENRQPVFSMLYLGINVGAAIGSMVAGMLFNNYMKLLFVGDAVATVISILLLVIFVEETKPSEDINEDCIVGQINENEKAEDGGLLAALMKRPLILVFSLFNTIFSFVYAQTGYSLPLYADAVFGDDRGAQLYGTFNMINCIVVLSLTTLVALVTRKISAIHNVAISGFFYAVGFGMLYFANGFWIFALSTVIWTIGEVLSATNVGVYLANHTPASHRGRFNSIINIITGTGKSMSPYLMGSFIASNGIRNVWPAMFVLSMVATLAMFLLGTYDKNKLKRRHT